MKHEKCLADLQMERVTWKGMWIACGSLELSLFSRKLLNFRPKTARNSILPITKLSEEVDFSSKTSDGDFPSGPVVKNPPANPLQGSWVPSLVQEYSICCRTTKLKNHNY